jgi:hypothetical protein
MQQQLYPQQRTKESILHSLQPSKNRVITAGFQLSPVGYPDGNRQAARNLQSNKTKL